MFNIPKTPTFWYHEPTVLQKTLLLPASKIYSYIAHIRYNNPYKDHCERAKVIAVGGLTVGGSGKTMVCQFIAQMLLQHNFRPAILSRGFGRTSSQVLQVDLSKHSYKDVGDEPLLLANTCPTFVGQDRSASAHLAEEKSDILILDDGLMQKDLQPDIKVLVIDANQCIGNGYMLPLGPNRLTFSKIKTSIDSIIVIGKPDSKRQEKLDNIFEGFHNIFRGSIKIDKISGPVIAFCGIGYPEKFFNSLSQCSIVKKIVYPDHYIYQNKDIRELIHFKYKFGAKLVTTMKDFVKIDNVYRKEFTPLRAQLEIFDFDDFIINKISI